MADIIQFPAQSHSKIPEWTMTATNTIVLMTMVPISRDLNRAIRSAGYRMKESYEDVGYFTYVYERVETNGAA